MEKLGALRVLYCSNNKIKDWSEADRLGPLVSTHTICAGMHGRPYTAAAGAAFLCEPDKLSAGASGLQGVPSKKSQHMHSRRKHTNLIGTLLQLWLPLYASAPGCLSCCARQSSVSPGWAGMLQQGPFRSIDACLAAMATGRL